MMDRRFEAYKAHVVRPFFRDHFARLDRQIVLVDALAALNAGPEAVRDLERALADILKCFRPGANTWLSSVLRRRIGRIVFAATKADHLHHTSHDRLEAILALMARDAIARARFSGAQVKVLAMAAVRATREGEARVGGEVLPCILGYPMAGETIGGRTFDGSQEFAVFPGDLPEDPERALKEGSGLSEAIHFVRFRPPKAQRSALGGTAPLPHIRLDRALNMLLADRLA
jgi:predicted YcjX-like family ATPase